MTIAPDTPSSCWSCGAQDCWCVASAAKPTPAPTAAGTHCPVGSNNLGAPAGRAAHPDRPRGTGAGGNRRYTRSARLGQRRVGAVPASVRPER